MRRETVVAYSHVLFQHLHESTEENHGKSQKNGWSHGRNFLSESPPQETLEGYRFACVQYVPPISSSFDMMRSEVYELWNCTTRAI
jgi:hypothetical protein